MGRRQEDAGGGVLGLVAAAGGDGRRRAHADDGALLARFAFLGRASSGGAALPTSVTTSCPTSAASAAAPAAGPIPSGRRPGNSASVWPVLAVWPVLKNPLEGLDAGGFGQMAIEAGAARLLDVLGLRVAGERDQQRPAQ